MKAQIKKGFEAADHNKNGTLEFKELYALTVKAHENAGLNRPDEKAVRELLFKGDTNKDYRLNLQEYTDLVWLHLQTAADAERKRDEAARTKPEPEPKVVVTTKA